MSQRTCAIPECPKPSRSRGWCQAHYRRWFVHGDPLGGGVERLPKGSAAEDHFWRKVEKTETCWLWTAGINNQGYGVFKLKGRAEGAHRAAWLLSGATIDGENTLDHLCKVRRCVRPDHLEQVPLVENNRRSDSPTAVNGRKGTCLRGHPFDEANTSIVLSGRGRKCRACAAAYQRERRRRLKAS